MRKRVICICKRSGRWEADISAKGSGMINQSYGRLGKESNTALRKVVQILKSGGGKLKSIPGEFMRHEDIVKV